MTDQAVASSGDRILAAATRMAQAHGYGGLNIRELAQDVGIKAASIYHHFASKADLAAAVARRYYEDAAIALEALSAASGDPLVSLRRYPETFRKSLECDNRMCLSSFMAAEYDDLPEVVKKEVQAFADVNVAWLCKSLEAAGVVTAEGARERACAIYAAVAGAQLMARGRADIALFDSLINSYRTVGLLPG
ncbi:TetR/AcrR family transcriptional regulator [bacterium M00.F.Ca.ET.228.01.1.1]|uniref:Regulatory protein TetR n=1 Tax=Burkholderia sp. (strain CCGE1003) TaxID=640512 RepID=E1T8Z3_BURSG|nr:TetR/AcrR family transcriptional regulator [Paraburkholderia phenoliruptrix]MBW9129979.1 TetR/AcrR family transcriptional regulator [Paraburkholderia ginsengiterrae]TGP42100.1 TetR/AcrR family transcriptional regulator [bacterium M00.F.Ca.ET.228.01.1.1]TGR99531.1 TetR/AcrR family transcriptional regulator [bacterium M00.F.Ca.ET.191.01.1.1]TGU03898.1 TetR/AcrR family transcriptional regulator [bacterium M00.F.Ca.ET.155.01.1.1]MBW0448346.1 TetR/AcrR family transcriptional regulator [Paraburkh